jgi:hypothetical protein
MPDKKINSRLSDLLIRLSQSINMDCLLLLGEDGKELSSVGELGELSRADKDELLLNLKNHPEHYLISDEGNTVQIIKHGAVECFITPVSETVYLLAMASIERPSVLIRTMLTEILSASQEINEIVGKEWPYTSRKGTTKGEGQKTATMIKESPEQTESSEPPSLESLIADSAKSVKGKEASKFWDGATMDEQEYSQNGKTISFEDARRAGLVPDDKK